MTKTTMAEHYSVGWGARYVGPGFKFDRARQCYAYVIRHYHDGRNKARQMSIGVRFEYDPKSPAAKEAARLKALAHIATLTTE